MPKLFPKNINGDSQKSRWFDFILCDLVYRWASHKKASTFSGAIPDRRLWSQGLKSLANYPAIHWVSTPTLAIVQDALLSEPLLLFD